MSHVKKKTRLTAGHPKSMVSTTQTGQTLDDLLVWLKNCGTKGLDNGGLEFRNCEEDDGCGLGGFAKKDYVVGDVIFAIPLVCLISVTSAYDTAVTKLVRDAAIAFEDSSLVTSELLIWLFMIEQLGNPSSHYYPYLHSLDSQSPSPLSWPSDLQSALVGTNISTMETSLSSVKRHATFLDSVRQWAVLTKRPCTFMDADRFNITSLIWARGHYLARRYPARFSSNKNDESGELSREDQGDGREEGMMNLGALVPLLDILNHNPEQEWLTFEVVDPMSSAESSRLPATGTVKHYGTYYVREGGMSGVPNQLWKQLTSLLGDDGDDNTDTIPIVEQRIECETSSSLGTVHGNAAPQFIETNSFSDQHLSETGPNITREVAEVEGAEAEVEEEVEEVDENDENDASDAGSVVEIGIDECCMLKQCLTRKLDSLLSTNERASEVLESSRDPRAQYIKWYRAGQERIAREVLHALDSAISDQEQYDENSSVE